MFNLAWQVTGPLEVQPIGFQQMRELASKDEGIVLLGAGGNPQDWIDGVTGLLIEEKVSTPVNSPRDMWGGAYVLNTTGGRTDLLLTLKAPSPIDMGKLAMWRLRFGECSWLSDYVVNYSNQHT